MKKEKKIFFLKEKKDKTKRTNICLNTVRILLVLVIDTLKFK